MNELKLANSGQKNQAQGVTFNSATDGTGFINEKQLLARLPVSRRTLFNWRASGKIPCVRLGGRILFHWTSVEAALLRHQQGGGL